MAQEGAQGGGKGEARSLIDLALQDIFEDVFDRILDGQDLGSVGGQFAQRRIEGGGLAAAGRPGDE
ncbi:hypothetical protein D3C72_2126860 [compost metagenome]